MTLVRNLTSQFGLVPEVGERRKSLGDAVAAGLSAVLLAICAWAANAEWRGEVEIADFLAGIPHALSWLATLLYLLGSAVVVVLILGIAVGARRWLLARDVFVAAALAFAVSELIRRFVGDNGTRPTGADYVSSSFPNLRIAIGVAVTMTIIPYLTRPARRLFSLLVICGVIGVMVGGYGLPLDVLGALIVGYGVGRLVHVIFGSPAGLPTMGELREAGISLGLELSELELVESQPWVGARYRAVATDHGGVVLSVYGRDETDLAFFSKAWRFIWYRDSGLTLDLTREQQLEHNAYMLLLAKDGGVNVPQLIAAGTGGDSETGLLVIKTPEGVRLSDVDRELTADDARAFYSQIAQLGKTRVAHGQISAEAVIVGDEGAIWLTDFARGTANATEQRHLLDVAAALTLVAVRSNEAVAVELAKEVFGSKVLGTAIPMLQPSAFSRALRAEIKQYNKDHSTEEKTYDLLGQLRAEAVKETGVPKPDLAELRRVSPTDLLMVAGTLLGVWLLIGQLTGSGDIWAEIESANPAWIAVAFVLSQMPHVAGSVALTGAVKEPLPFKPVVILQFADTFTGLAGGTVAVVATNVRFFQRRGLSASIALTSGVLVSAAGMMVQATLLVIALVFANGEFNFQRDESASGGSSTWILLAIAAAVAALGVFVIRPRFRKRLWNKLKPQIADARSTVKTLATTPQRLLRVFGGNVASQLFFAMTLGAALHAYGGSESLATLIVINTMASLFGGMAPIPGGMGVMEATMVAGLTAAGTEQDVAVAAVLTARMFTAYLPPIWGWFSMVWLRRHEYL